MYLSTRYEWLLLIRTVEIHWIYTSRVFGCVVADDCAIADSITTAISTWLIWNIVKFWPIFVVANYCAIAACVTISISTWLIWNIVNLWPINHWKAQVAEKISKWWQNVIQELRPYR